MSLPADGDPPNASTFIQAYKVCADFIDFNMKPQAKSTDYAKHIHAWRSALGHKRFLVDHFGFPAGKLVHRRESLMSSFLSTAATSGVLKLDEKTVSSTQVLGPNALPGWSYKIVRAGAATPSALVAFKAPSLASPARPDSWFIELNAADTVNDFSAVGMSAVCIYRANNAIVLEWDAALSNSANTAAYHVMGISDNISAGPLAPATAGAWFLGDAGANWQCVCRDNLGGTTTLNSGVARDNNWHRFKVVMAGSGASDDSVARSMFFIDGTLVGNTNLTQPAADSHYAGAMFGSERFGAGSISALYIGAPVNLAFNTWQDVAL